MPDLRLIDKLAVWLEMDFMMLFIFVCLLAAVVWLIRGRVVREFQLFSDKIYKKLDQKADTARCDNKFNKIDDAFEKIDSVCDIRYRELSEDIVEVKTLTGEDRKKLVTLESKILEHEIETRTKIKSIESNIAIMQPILQQMSEQVNQIWGRLSADSKQRKDG